jgi:hypothetical protein
MHSVKSQADSRKGQVVDMKNFKLMLSGRLAAPLATAGAYLTGTASLSRGSS